MATGMSFIGILMVGGLLVGLAAIAGGIVLLVVGSRRRDDSTSRPFLAFGITALAIGTAVTVPVLLSLAMGFAGLR